MNQQILYNITDHQPKKEEPILDSSENCALGDEGTKG